MGAVHGIVLGVPGRWTEDRVARELEAWFAQRCFDVWPSYRTFVADGHKRLHAALVRHGGPERWAGELGVPLVAHRPGRRMSDDEIHAALHALLREQRPRRFPSEAWLREHGPAGLGSAVRSSGGTVRWARELGLAPAREPRWSDERIEHELRALCAGTTRWPTRAQFTESGRDGLLRAVYSGRGSRWWATRLGLELQHPRHRRPGTM